MPNVANIYVRLICFLDASAYADRGILDETHLRFFTLNSACALIAESRPSCETDRGHVDTVTSAASEHERREGHAIFCIGQTRLLQMWKRLFAYQVIIVAVSRNLRGSGSLSGEHKVVVVMPPSMPRALWK